MKGTATLAKICGQRWPRLLPKTYAAAYCGMSMPKFMSCPELAMLVMTIHGEDVVDKLELDETINTMKKDSGKWQKDQ